MRPTAPGFNAGVDEELAILTFLTLNLTLSPILKGQILLMLQTLPLHKSGPTRPVFAQRPPRTGADNLSVFFGKNSRMSLPTMISI
jgi:hypothetical protein